MKRFIFAVAVAGSVALLSGAASAQLVIVRERPPPIVREVRIARPGPGHVWIPGYHHWDNGRWNWNAGRWAMPERRGAVWVRPMYNRRPGGQWGYIPGRWR